MYIIDIERERSFLLSLCLQFVQNGERGKKRRGKCVYEEGL